MLGKAKLPDGFIYMHILVFVCLQMFPCVYGEAVYRVKTG